MRGEPSDDQRTSRPTAPADGVHDAGGRRTGARVDEIVDGGENIGVVEALAEAKEDHHFDKGGDAARAGEAEHKDRADQEPAGLDENSAANVSSGEPVGEHSAKRRADGAGGLDERRCRREISASRSEKWWPRNSRR